MRTARWIFAAAIAAAALAACSDRGVEPDAFFSLDIEAVDSVGRPVEGLEVLLHIPLQTLATPKSDKATFHLRFVLAEDAHVRMTAHDWLGRYLDTLLDEERSAGDHEIQWEARTEDGKPIVGTVPITLLLEAQPAEGELVEDTQDLLLYTGFDLDQMPVLGITSADGRVPGIGRDNFPFLYELPHYLATDEGGNPVGETRLSSSVDLVLRDPSDGSTQSYRHTIRDAPDRKVLVWNP